MRRGPLLPGPDDPICATPPRQAHWYELVGVAGKALCYMPIGKQVVRNNEHACGNHVAGHVHGGRISPYTHAWSGVRDRNLQVHVTHSITSSLGLHAHSAANAIYNKRRYPVPSRVQSSSAADARLLGHRHASTFCWQQIHQNAPRTAFHSFSRRSVDITKCAASPRDPAVTTR